jgi:serpin B
MKRISPFLFILLLFTSCQIFPEIDDAAIGSFSIEVTMDDMSPAAVSMIYENAQGESSTALLNLQQRGQILYITENIHLETGNYNLMQCMILDANDSIIAAAPVAGSEMSGSVTTTLPWDFSIVEDEETTIEPEIIAYSTTDTPAKYGYTSATSTVIGLYDDFGTSINNFTFDILTEITAEDSENVFISPVSMVYAFGLLYPGCGATTSQEIKDVFYLNDLADSDEELYQLYMDFGTYLKTLDDGVELALAHAFWYDLGLTPKSSYLSIINSYFGAETEQIDFRNTSNVVNEINNWAAENTNDKVTKVVDESDVGSWVAALANATYFKGNWVNGFEANKTNNQTFYKDLDSTASVSCQMMHGGTIDDPWGMKCYREQDLQLVRIPFKDKSRYEMVCLMPLNKTCEEFLADLDGEQWNDWMDHSHTMELILNMPKFEEKHKYYLKNALYNLGMQSMFTSPDLTGIFINSNNLAVDEVIQGTFISVDETGAEAAAVTVIGMWESAEPMVSEFTFDHPFIYAIQDAETHAIIFIGTMKNPVFSE